MCVWRVCGMCVCGVLCYRDDVQDAEKAVDAVSWVNLLHHVFLPILRDRDMHVLSFSYKYSLNQITYLLNVTKFQGPRFGSHP